MEINIDYNKEYKDIREHLKFYSEANNGLTYDIDTYFGGKTITKYNSEVLRCIKDYTTNNLEALSTPLLELIVFGDYERSKFIKAYHIDERDFANFASTQEFLKNGWITVNDPLNLALYLSFVHTGKREFLEFLGIKMMSSLMYKYYTKNGSLNPGIMRFIVYGMKNNKPVMSNKYLLKSEGDTIGMIKAIINTVVEDHLKKRYHNKNLNADEIVIDVINSISTRLNLSMRGIRDLYDQYKNERLYEQQDINTEEINITVENETIKLATLNAKISEKIIGGLDTTLVRRTGNVKYFDEIKAIYESDRQGVIEFCQYLLKFYASKTNNLSFENMKENFVGVVTKAKGIDMSFILSMVDKYQIRDKQFPRSFLNMHVVLVYDLILDMAL